MSDEQIVQQPKQGLAALGTKEEMIEQLGGHSEKLHVAHEYVKSSFVKGIDYGPADPRNDKLVLLKPGAEKVCQLFNTRPTWRRDTDTWEMLGKPAGTVCYICQIVNNVTGEIIGEGRGAEKVGNKSRDANKVIKIAEKCALVDAALNTFGLSEMFTQDMAPATNNLNDKKRELMAEVDNLRTGCESSLTTVAFIKTVCEDYLHIGSPQSVGAVEKLRDAIVVQQLYCLETGERFPQ